MRGKKEINSIRQLEMRERRGTRGNAAKEDARSVVTEKQRSSL